ncbi:uncharacterized protein LOC125236798 [Leguminivora glycinivorella]|uniref:uncharacterized protein LOC125236798 n=1 Tax=Leguminivora glycinivorella TaxID=1035111 RepID=UPI00201070D6|nr:uncharacterized protein LOC125236798 [Leguminivora glycinivorella]
MKSLIFLILLIASIHAFTIPNPKPVTQALEDRNHEALDHKINKRFISALLMSMMDDDDYFDDDLPSITGRRRPSRRHLQLAQMMRQLAGPRGLTRGQMDTMMSNLQNLQLLQNMQQLMQLQSQTQNLPTPAPTS